MNLKPNFVAIPLFTVVTAVVGGAITSAGMGWYKQLHLPSFTPPGSVIGTVWTILFVLATISALIAYNAKWGKRKIAISQLFILNAILNVGWSLLFFGLHLAGPAIFEAFLLGLSVVALIVYIWPVSKFASWLLVPYAAWVFFATFLTYSIYIRN